MALILKKCIIRACVFFKYVTGFLLLLQPGDTSFLGKNTKVHSPSWVRRVLRMRTDKQGVRDRVTKETATASL